jgi:hypothetical protein
MNTKAFQEQVLALKKADNAAFTAGTKSNFVIDYVRNEFIKRAHALNSNCSEEVTVELSMTVASVIAPALALLSKDGQYPRLLTTAVQTYTDGLIKFTYTINPAALSEEYVARLNEKLNIKITI